MIYSKLYYLIYITIMPLLLKKYYVNSLKRFISPILSKSHEWNKFHKTFSSDSSMIAHNRKWQYLTKLRSTNSNKRDCNTFENNFYITTPIYYVNGEPHLGHAYTSTMADVIARFWKLDGKNVYFLTGTDEHGQKVQQSAEKVNIQPIELANTVSGKFRDLLKVLNIENDDFIRTTEDRHKAAVKELWKKLHDKGQIYLGSYEGWYSIRDEAFYAENELIDGKAPTGADVEWVKEESYFFRLSDYTQKLLDYYETHPEFIGPKGRRNEVISFVGQEGGLKDLSISRTTFTWGVPVPGNEKHVVYVWLDALTNYLSALGYTSTDSKNEIVMKQFWPPSLHIVGKDILRFHAVFWPAFLMAADLDLPKRIFAHGWWTKDGEKMSKSIGNVLDPFDLVDKYGADYLRYFLVAEVPFGNDGDFNDDALANRINSELANDIGNLFQRVLTFIQKNCDSKIPYPSEDMSQVATCFEEDDKIILNSALDLMPLIREAVKQQNMKQMIDYIISIARIGNKYIDNQAPWTLKKNQNISRMNTVLYVLSELLRQLGIILQPVIPTASKVMLDQLGISQQHRDFEDLLKSPIEPGSSIGSPSPIFPKIEMNKPKDTEKLNSKTTSDFINSPLIDMYKDKSIDELEALIISVGEKIRTLKSMKSDKQLIQEKVEELLILKDCYKIANNGVAYQQKM